MESYDFKEDDPEVQNAQLLLKYAQANGGDVEEDDEPSRPQIPAENYSSAKKGKHRKAQQALGEDFEEEAAHSEIKKQKEIHQK